MPRPAAPGLDCGRPGDRRSSHSSATAARCTFSTQFRLLVDQPTSVAFGGDDLSTLYITTAREDLTPAEVAAQPH
jgi:hypothetical protein